MPSGYLKRFEQLSSVDDLGWGKILLEVLSIASHEIICPGSVRAFVKAIVWFVRGMGELSSNPSHPARRRKRQGCGNLPALNGQKLGAI